MMVSEGLSQAVFGVAIATILGWMRDRKFLGSGSGVKYLTLFASHSAAILSAVGVHWMFEGDMLTTGGTLTVGIPSLYHIFNGLVLYASNFSGQRLMVHLRKGTDSASTIAAFIRKLEKDPATQTRLTSLLEQLKKLEADKPRIEALRKEIKQLETTE